MNSTDHINKPFVYTAKLVNRMKDEKHASSGSHTSSYQEVQTALKELEAFSLSSSEEINDNIE